MKKIFLFSLLFLSGCISFNENLSDPRVMSSSSARVIDEKALMENVIIKDAGDHHISYKYKNVRVDEVAKLASRYCFEKSQDAYLRDVVLDKQNYRIATFDCVVVSKK